MLTIARIHENAAASMRTLTQTVTPTVVYVQVATSDVDARPSLTVEFPSDARMVFSPHDTSRSRSPTRVGQR
jgi:hypothetical protein